MQEAIVAIFSGLGIFVLWRLISFIIDYFQKTKIPYKFVKNQGYRIGKLLYNKSIKNIKDKTTRVKVIQFYDKIPDYFNKGFDAGIRGLINPTI